MGAPSLIVAKDPIDLWAQVQKALEREMDILAQPVVHDGLIGQHMSSGDSVYEYRLVVGEDLFDYGAQVCNLGMMDFTPMWTAVRWNGKLVQWMCRWKDGKVSTVSSYQQLVIGGRLLDSEEADPALRADELKLVEGVREALQLGEGGRGSFSSDLPFPLRSE